MKQSIELICLLSFIVLSCKADSLAGEGEYLNDVLLTDKGEVAIDYSTGERLPEEMNDGELEGGDRHTSWNYEQQNAWSSEYPICLGKNRRQSPIDIQLDQVQIKPQMGIRFVDYNQEVEFELKNNHHTVSLTPVTPLTTPSIELSWLPGEKFELQEIHFHWGSQNNKGSEHEIDGQRSAAEMHMVHYKKGINKKDIGSVDNSVVVVGVLIDSDESSQTKLDPVIGSASKVNGTDDACLAGKHSNLLDLLPENRRAFFTYEGSLTTPPCYEVVTWIVMSQPTFVSNEMLTALTNIEANLPQIGRRKILANNRNVQPLLDRPVYGSSSVTELDTNAPITKDPSRMAKALKIFWKRMGKIKQSVRKSHEIIRKARVDTIKRLSRPK